MDFWDSNTMRLYVGMDHQERMAQGEAARRQARALGRRTVRARLAAALVVLAARLDPALAPARQPTTALAPAA